MENVRPTDLRRERVATDKSSRRCRQRRVRPRGQTPRQGDCSVLPCARHRCERDCWSRGGLPNYRQKLKQKIFSFQQKKDHEVVIFERLEFEQRETQHLPVRRTPAELPLVVDGRAALPCKESLETSRGPQTERLKVLLPVTVVVFLVGSLDPP